MSTFYNLKGSQTKRGDMNRELDPLGRGFCPTVMQKRVLSKFAVVQLV